MTNKEKGGEEMANICEQEIVLKCQFCGKTMPPTRYREQAEQWLISHETHCKEKPSKSENGKV